MERRKMSKGRDARKKMSRVMWIAPKIDLIELRPERSAFKQMGCGLRGGVAVWAGRVNVVVQEITVGFQAATETRP